MRILVNPDQLRALSGQLQQVAGDLRGVESRVGGALGGLDWEARQKVGMEGQAGNARNQARALAAQAEEMGRHLAGKAQAFEEADEQGVGLLGRLGISFSDWWEDWFQSSPRWWNLPVQEITAWWNLGGVLAQPPRIQIPSLPLVGSTSVIGFAGLTALSTKLSAAARDFLERIQGWLVGVSSRNIFDWLGNIDIGGEIISKLEGKGYVFVFDNEAPPEGIDPEKLIRVKQGDLRGVQVGGNYDYKTRTLTVDNDLLHRLRSEGVRAAILVHELQHALQHAEGRLPPKPPEKLPENADGFRVLSAEQIGDLERDLATYYRQYLELEAEATNVERKALADFEGSKEYGKPADVKDRFDAGYGRSYEKGFSGAYDGKVQIDLNVDQQGNVTVKIITKAETLSGKSWWQMW